MERRSRGRGRVFWGCTKYPTCDLILNTRPVMAPCPECDGLMVEQGRDQVACTSCAWKGLKSDYEQEAVAVAD